MKHNDLVKKLCSGKEWYEQQAFKAVNQAMGRCIRHKNDYGAMLLLDERYLRPEKQDRISKWDSGRIQTHRSFFQMLNSVSQFFEDKEALPGPPEDSWMSDRETPSLERKRPASVSLEQNGRNSNDAKQPKLD